MLLAPGAGWPITRRQWGGPLSGRGGQCSDAVERVDVVAVPGPAGGEVQGPAAGVAGQAAARVGQLVPASVRPPDPLATPRLGRRLDLQTSPQNATVCRAAGELPLTDGARLEVAAAEAFALVERVGARQRRRPQERGPARDAIRVADHEH